MHAVRGFVPFAFCFALLMMIWYEHYVYFRRYDMHRGSTLWLNTLLLFVVLFYVYPLKFITSLDKTGEFPPGGAARVMLLYGAGIAAIYTIYTLMYWDAWRSRDDLELTDVERFDTWTSIIDNASMVGVAAVAMLLALLLPDRVAGASGFAYFSVGIVRTVSGTLRGKRRRRLEERLDALEVQECGTEELKQRATSPAISGSPN
jgi:uncharacterized membrane protein